MELCIASPKLWSIEETNRYLARVTVYNKRKQVDVYDAPFGIRTIEFTHDNGFLLNGKRVQINGTCNHHDLGAFRSGDECGGFGTSVAYFEELRL